MKTKILWRTWTKLKTSMMMTAIGLIKMFSRLVILIISRPTVRKLLNDSYWDNLALEIGENGHQFYWSRETTVYVPPVDQELHDTRRTLGLAQDLVNNIGHEFIGNRNAANLELFVNLIDMANSIISMLIILISYLKLYDMISELVDCMPI